jgi:hypothetical protein
MYELFDKLYKNRESTEDILANELFVLVPNEKLVKYLVTFREDVCKCLEQSKFFEKSLDGIVDEAPQQKKQGREKEKSTRWMPQEAEELDEVNFLNMTTQ